MPGLVLLCNNICCPLTKDFGDPAIGDAQQTQSDVNEVFE